MSTKTNNIKISTMVNNKQYKYINSEILRRKLNNEKRIGVGRIVREAIDFYIENKDKTCCVKEGDNL